MTAMQVLTTIRKAIESDPRTQVEIAKAAKINAVNLSQFKRGGWLRIDGLCRLADVLGLEVSIKRKAKAR